MDSTTYGLLTFIAALFVLVLAILWTILPFAVFGIKGRLDRLIVLQKQQVDHIASLRADLERLRGERDAADGMPR